MGIRERVICVLTTGQAWQFKPYKWSEPRELFHRGEPILMAVLIRLMSRSERILYLLDERSS